MGKLFPIGWIFVLRPIVACLIPPGLLEFIKRSEGVRNRNDARSKVESVQINIEEESTALRGIGALAGSVGQTN